MRGAAREVLLRDLDGDPVHRFAIESEDEARRLREQQIYRWHGRTFRYVGTAEGSVVFREQRREG